MTSNGGWLCKLLGSIVETAADVLDCANSCITIAGNDDASAAGYFLATTGISGLAFGPPDVPAVVIEVVVLFLLSWRLAGEGLAVVQRELSSDFTTGPITLSARGAFGLRWTLTAGSSGSPVPLLTSVKHVGVTRNALEAALGDSCRATGSGDVL